MFIEGTVTTGYNKGAYFMAQEFYATKFEEILGYRPYEGTLNIIISEEDLPKIQRIKNECNSIITGEDGFGTVGYKKCTLEDKISGAIVFPVKTTHKETYLEFIAEKKLRELLNLNDGDRVKLEIKKE